MKTVLIVNGKQVGECSPTYRHSDDEKEYIFRLRDFNVSVKRSNIGRFDHAEVNGLGIFYIKTKEGSE